MSKRNKRQKQSRFKKIPDLENLKQINLNAGGIDIGSAEIWVCVPKDRDEESVKKFDTFTIDLFSSLDNPWSYMISSRVKSLTVKRKSRNNTKDSRQKLSLMINHCHAH